MLEQGAEKVKGLCCNAAADPILLRMLTVANISSAVLGNPAACDEAV